MMLTAPVTESAQARYVFVLSVIVTPVPLRDTTLSLRRHSAAEAASGLPGYSKSLNHSCST